MGRTGKSGKTPAAAETTSPSRTSSHQQQQQQQQGPPPCFIVYPLPSIADESFLQVIFRGHVRRSLFFGFGRGRFAITELDSDAMASEAADILAKDAQSSAAATAAAAQASASAVGDRKADVGGASHDKGTESAEETNGSRGTDAQEDQDDAIENMTLADLFASATSAAAAAAAPETEADSHATVAVTVAADSRDLTHLPHLVWRGRPVHVVVSGARVADFFGSGGVVPQHRTAGPASASGGAGKKNAKAAKRPRESEANGGGAASAVDAGSDADVTTAPKGVDVGPADGAASAAEIKNTKATSTQQQQKFPKNCCQKCGSSTHFTRHCDNSGPAATTTTIDTSGSGDASGPAAHTNTGGAEEESPSTEATAANRQKMSRHEPTAVSSTRHANENQQRHQQHTVETPVKAKPPPPQVQRTSKDQCKHCGSEAHLSRHCPSKN